MLYNVVICSSVPGEAQAVCQHLRRKGVPAAADANPQPPGRLRSVDLSNPTVQQGLRADYVLVLTWCAGGQHEPPDRTAYTRAWLSDIDELILPTFRGQFWLATSVFQVQGQHMQS